MSGIKKEIMTKYFKGYWIIGCANKKQAQEKKGLILWNQVEPKKIIRFFNKILLNIYWVSENREIEKGKDIKTELNQPKARRYKK